MVWLHWRCIRLHSALITSPVTARMLVLIIKFDIRLAAEWARGHTVQWPGSADTSPASARGKPLLVTGLGPSPVCWPQLRVTAGDTKPQY